ncbi:MAG: drug/metabolite transporter (DMT)-like permease [Limisphaerales bacterium]|jgi:drug/metabolite transporter (DMT)-like permease
MNKGPEGLDSRPLDDSQKVKLGGRMAQQSTRTLLDYVLLFTLTVIWGSSFILYKEGLKGLDWNQVAILRILIGSVCFVPMGYYWWKRTPKKALLAIFAVGLCGSGFPPFLFSLAQTKLESGLTGILNTLTPIFTLLIGIVLFGLAINKWKATGLLIGLIGAAAIILVDPEKGLSGNALSGFYVILATACYAMSTNIVKAKLQDVHPIAIGVFAMLTISIPTLFLLPSADLVETWQTVEGAGRATFFASILGIFCTAVANILYFMLVQRTDVVFASTVTYMVPIVAIGWGLLDGESFIPMHFLGMGLILFGVWLTGRK